MNINNLKEEDHSKIVGALRQNYPLLLGHDEFRRRLDDHDEPSWIECFNYLIELGVIDNDVKEVFRTIEAIHDRFQTLYDRIEPQLKAKVEKLLDSLRYANSTDELLLRLNRMSEDPVMVTADRDGRLLRDTVRSASRIITHGRTLYDDKDDLNPIVFSKDDRLNLLKKDIGGAVKGGVTAGMAGTLIGGPSGTVIGTITGGVAGAIISSAGETAEISFSKILNMFRRRNNH